MLHADAGAAYSFRAVQDNERLELGNVHLEVLHTPGHTPEHLSLLVVDRTRGPDAWALLTGHTLMVGDLGRTELATDAVTGARALFATTVRLRQLPDYLEVWPGAFAGSVCGREGHGGSGSVGRGRGSDAARSSAPAKAWYAAMALALSPVAAAARNP